MFFDRTSLSGKPTAFQGHISDNYSCKPGGHHGICNSFCGSSNNGLHDDSYNNGLYDDTGSAGHHCNSDTLACIGYAPALSVRHLDQYKN
jgi:hypothetical protein